MACCDEPPDLRRRLPHASSVAVAHGDTVVASLSALQLATRASVGAALALAVAQRLDLDFPIYAMIAAVIVTDLSPARTRELALPRLAGTVLGAVTGAVFTMMLAPGPIAVGVAILATMLMSTALRFENAARLAGYVCGIVILDHHDEQWRYAALRFVETLIGIVAAVGISLVPKLLPLRR
jgi:uncharacterized membrane protein YgaE (UPF0421/DUF939 family)